MRQYPSIEMRRLCMADLIYAGFGLALIGLMVGYVTLLKRA